MDYVVLKIGLYLTVFKVLHGLNIPLSDRFHTEKTNVEFLSSADRSRRETERHLPENTLLKLEVAGTLQHFHIEKNYNIDVSDIPIFISNNGEAERTYISLDQEHVVYQAPEIGGSFLVTRHKIVNKSPVIFGTFHHNSSLYIIQPDASIEAKREDHIVSRIPDQQLIFESITPTGASVPTFQQFTSSSNHDNRRSRRQIKTYSVELMSVIDFKSYKFWYDMTSGTNRYSEAVQLVIQYVAYIINSVDVRYKTITGENSFNILSAGIYIADRSLSSPWSESNVIDGRVSSSATLASFTEWIKGQTSLPQFDHAMGFTGYDIVSAGTGDSSGIAYTSVLCTPDSTSIIEDSFNFITMTTAAHELGHSLGALHDGVGNTCDGNDNYIMASVNSVVTDTAKGQNLWKFSPCSVQEFNTYINKLDRINNNCMLKTNSTSKVATTLRPMAEAYPADDTCVYRFGEGSYVCRSIQNYETICITMYCNQPGSSQCYSTIPAEGTPCGKGKWCNQGRCVLSSRAPSNNADNCALGDRPGLFDNTGKTCAQYIEDDPAKCYGDYTGASCCESCNSKKTGDASCEFGDHGRSFCATMSRYGCYLNEEYCCSTCKQVKNSALPGCEYGDKSNGCRKEDCWRYTTTDLANCCETCFDPSKATSTTTKRTTTSTTPSITTTRPTTTSTTPITTTKRTTTSTTPSITTTRTTTTSITVTKTTIQPSTETELTSTQVPVAPESDLILIVTGCGVGAVLVIVSVAILCLILKRRKAKRAAADRKPSTDNSYDNIGFVSVMSEKPRHPPPRRNSHQTSLHNVSNGSAIIPVNFIGDGTSASRTH